MGEEGDKAGEKSEMRATRCKIKTMRWETRTTRWIMRITKWVSGDMVLSQQIVINRSIMHSVNKASTWYSVA